MTESAANVSLVVEEVLRSPKYATVCRDLVERLAAAEITKRRTAKESIKAVKNKLHQVAGAYASGDAPYAAWLADLAAARSTGDQERLRAACRDIMAAHASTRERLPILDAFYATTLAGCGPLHSVLDLACGLNPLALPWLPLAEGATYYAYDIYGDMMDFLGAAMPLLGVQGTALARDIIGDPPRQRADLALLLKAIPCLEQTDKSAGLRLLDAVDARYVLVSFPVHSLGGRSKGMSAAYEAHFRAMIGQRDWTAQRYAFSTELAFLVTKPTASQAEDT
jgi:16S rRNA (guanine(1405)-N(7))-methyltransferase